jgi:porin
MIRQTTFAFALVAGASAARAADPLITPRLSLSPTLDSPADIPDKPTSPATTGYGLLGDLFGHRARLDECHFCFEGYVLLDISKNFRGGIDTENYAVRYLLDLHLTIDADALGLPGGTAFIDFQTHDQTANVDTLAGDYQAYDNLEGPRYVAISQLWYKQQLGDFRLKLGRIDANTDAAAGDNDAIDAFSLIEHGLDFIHSSAAYTPTIFVMPTYPNPSPGIQLFYGKPDGFYAGAGAFYSNSHQTLLNFSGHPETVFLSSGGSIFIAETGSRWLWDGKPGHAGLGGWYHTGNFPAARNPDSTHRGAGGGYFLLDQALYQEEIDGEVSREIGAFFTAGASDTGAAPMNLGLTAGITASGFIPSRPDDVVGLLSSWVQLTAPPDDLLMSSGEWATEAFYKLQITDWASLKPAFTYIASPSGWYPDAALATLRIEVVF